MSRHRCGVIFRRKNCLTKCCNFGTAPRKRMAGEEELPALVKPKKPGLSIFVTRRLRQANRARLFRRRQISSGANSVLKLCCLTNAGIDVHIDMNSLVRNNRELLWFRSDVTLRRPSLHIQNVIARWQCETIVSISVCSNPRDFFFSVLAQDDQRIFGIISSTELWRISLGKLNIFSRKNPQMSFEETRRSVIRCQTDDRNQKDASPNQVFEVHDVQKMGGIDFRYPAQN